MHKRMSVTPKRPRKQVLLPHKPGALRAYFLVGASFSGRLAVHFCRNQYPNSRLEYTFALFILD